MGISANEILKYIQDVQKELHVGVQREVESVDRGVRITPAPAADSRRTSFSRLQESFCE